MATCKSCDAPILWCRTKNGKAMPVDATDDGHPLPYSTGNVILKPMPDGTPLAEVVGVAPSRYLSHFVTCPQRDQHRRRK